MVRRFPGTERPASYSKASSTVRRQALLLLLAAIALTVGLAGCSKSSTTTSLAITTLTPATGSVGTAVTISGSGFGATQASNSAVVFNGIPATPLSWNATTIVVDVPSKATTGNVVVTAGGAASPGSSFTVNATNTSPCGGAELGYEAILYGTYAYTLSGYEGLSPGTPFNRAGSFVSNGMGVISSGQEDFNLGSSGDDLHSVTSGTYSVGADYRGCATLNYSDGGSATFRFSLGTIGGVAASVASSGHIIQFDDSNGLGHRASGLILQQSVGAFTASNFPTHFAFGLQGVNATGGRVSQAGTFTLAPGAATNNISAGYFDYNNSGAVQFSGGTNGLSAGTLHTTVGSISTTTGRTTGSFIAEPTCAATCTYNWAVYIVNQNQFFIISTDSLGANTPLVAGRAADTATGYISSYLSTASADGYIVAATGATAGAANARLDKLTFTATNVSGTQWTYASGAPAQNTITSTAFTPSSVGRFTFGNTVLYLANPTASDGLAGFVVANDNTAANGLMVLQSSFGFSPRGNGRFFLGSLVMADSNVRNQIGVAGALPNSTGSSVVFGGTTDQNAATATNILSTSSFLTTLTVSSTNGAVTGSDGNGGNIVGIANGNSMFYIDETGDAALTAVAQ